MVRAAEVISYSFLNALFRDYAIALRNRTNPSSSAPRRKIHASHRFRCAAQLGLRRKDRAEVPPRTDAVPLRAEPVVCRGRSFGATPRASSASPPEKEARPHARCLSEAGEGRRCGSIRRSWGQSHSSVAESCNDPTGSTNRTDLGTDSRSEPLRMHPGGVDLTAGAAHTPGGFSALGRGSMVRPTGRLSCATDTACRITRDSIGAKGSRPPPNRQAGNADACSFWPLSGGCSARLRSAQDGAW